MMAESTPSTHRVNIVRITDIRPHPNADKLEIVPVGGFQVVARKGQFQVGQLAAYIQPDSLVPEKPVYSFLWERDGAGNPRPPFDGPVPDRYRRVGVKKLRKEYSEGLLMALAEVGLHEAHPTSSVWPQVEEGQDVAELLGITHYNPPEPDEVQSGGRSVKQSKILPRSLKGWFYFLSYWLTFGLYNPWGDLGGGNEKAPENTPPIYDVEAYKNHTDVFQAGEPVWATEKIHGCVTADTRVRMADGSSKRITAVEVGEYVLGVDDYDRIIPARVTNTFDNGKTTAWLRIAGSRKGAGRGNCFFSVVCTPNHRFWTPCGYVKAEDLKVGDQLATARTDMGLTPAQTQILLGKLLGDGHLAICGNMAAVHYGHRIEDREYLNWCARGLGELDSGDSDQRTSGYGSPMERRRTVGSFFIKEKFGIMCADGRKGVPAWVADELTPLAVAFWYMDDGSLTNHADQEDRAAFAVAGFNISECQILLKGLARLGISGQVKTYDGYNRLVLNSENAEKLFLLIAPYVPPCMQRKLPMRYRGGEGWLPSSKLFYKSSLVWVSIGDISPAKPGSKRYDLETETNNYFANNILTHNSNFRAVFVPSLSGGKFYVGSRKLWKKAKSANVWRRAAEKNPDIEKWCRANPGCVLYGEVVPTQKGFDYGATAEDPKVFLFDVRLPNGEWVPKPDAKMMTLQHHIEWVPTLQIGDWSEDFIRFADGATETGANHIREGCVVCTVPDRYTHAGRAQLKIVSSAYYELALNLESK